MSLLLSTLIAVDTRTLYNTDRYITMGQSASTPTTVTGVNEIPPPQFDADANAPPRKQHDRVIDFVRVSPGSTIRCRGK
jgi:hypothetical protein